MCAGLTVYNGLRNAGFEPGDRVAVIGLGGLGHLGVLYAKAMGARVAVLSGSPDKEDEAKELGAERFISEEGTALSEALLDWEGGANIILATAPPARPRRPDHGVGEARLSGKRRSPDRTWAGLL